MDQGLQLTATVVSKHGMAIEAKLDLEWIQAISSPATQKNMLNFRIYMKSHPEPETMTGFLRGGGGGFLGREKDLQGSSGNLGEFWGQLGITSLHPPPQHPNTGVGRSSTYI